LAPVVSAAELLESLVALDLAPGGILNHYFSSAKAVSEEAS
jgi:hypothetical protein